MRRVATSSRSNVDSGCTRDYTSQFTATQTFKSKEELIKWAKEVGRSNNITVVVLRSDSGNGKKKPRVTLGCERSGKCDIRNTRENMMMDKSGRQHTGTKKSDCPFRLTGKMLAAGDEWQLKVVEGKHNHEAEDTTGKQGHSFQGRLSHEEKSLVKDMYERGKQPMEILGELKKRDKHNKSEPRTIYNERQRLKRVEELEILEDRNARLQQLMSRAEEYGFITKKTKTSPKMETASYYLLTHPTSLELLLAFPTVLIIRILWDLLPCWSMLEVYGVTPTDVRFFVALAITSTTQRGSDEWECSLTLLRGVMNDWRITMPDIVILDICPITSLPPLMELEPINDVFRTAKVLLSTDTVSAFVAIYTRQISELDERVSFIKKWKLLIASPTGADLEGDVKQLRTEFDMYPQTLEYVIDNLLKPYKEMFVAAWTDKVMHFGTSKPDFCTESCPSEFMLDYLYTHDGVDVDQTVIDKILKYLHDDNDEVKDSLEKSLEIEYNDQDGFFPELKKLHGTISIRALRLIREQTILASLIDDDYGEYCSCAIRSTHGLPCAHDIAKYIRERQPIPLECINSHWMKLDLKPLSKTAEPLVEERSKRRSVVIESSSEDISEPQLQRRRTILTEAEPSVTIHDHDLEVAEREALGEMLDKIIPVTDAALLSSLPQDPHGSERIFEESLEVEIEPQASVSSDSPLQMFTNASQRGDEDCHSLEGDASLDLPVPNPSTAVVPVDQVTTGTANISQEIEATSLGANAAGQAEVEDVVEHQPPTARSPVQETATAATKEHLAPQVTEVVEPQTLSAPANLPPPITLIANNNFVVAKASTSNAAAPTTSFSIAERLKALVRPSVLPTEVIQAKAFLANLEQLDLEAEGSEQALRDNIATLKPYATPEDLEKLSQLEALAAIMPSGLDDLEEQKTIARERQDAFSQLDQSFHSVHRHLTSHFESTVAEAELKLSGLEKQKAEIEAKIEATKLARDEQLALANQQLTELQERKTALDQASSQARIAEGHLRLSRSELNQLKLELDVLGKQL